MVSDFGIEITLWNILAFLIGGLGLAVVAVLVVRWLAEEPKPPTKPPARRW